MTTKNGRRRSRRLIETTFLCILLSCQIFAQSTGRGSGFWKLESEKSTPLKVTTFTAKDAPYKGQGLLMWTTLPAADKSVSDELDARRVLAGLYKDLKEFKVLGKKSVKWGGRPAHLVGFKAKSEKRTIVGRLLMSDTDDGIETLLMVRNPEAPDRFRSEFDAFMTRWEFGRPGASNVLYSE